MVRLLSVRALVLTVVLLVGFTMLFPTIRAYLGQQAQLASLAAEVEAAEQHQRDLEAERARWDDPAYIEAQARERLSYVQPGETSYRVIDPEIVVEAPLVDGAVDGPVAGPALPPGGAVAPWYATVWESVQLAGESAMPDDAEPADQVPAGQVPGEVPATDLGPADQDAPEGDDE